MDPPARIHPSVFRVLGEALEEKKKTTVLKYEDSLERKQRK